jgi:hypothetical protein
MTVTLEKKPRVRAIPKVPEALVYEILDGKPFYYKGYKEVLFKKKRLKKL